MQNRSALLNGNVNKEIINRTSYDANAFSALRNAVGYDGWVFVNTCFKPSPQPYEYAYQILGFLIVLVVMSPSPELILPFI